MKHINYLLSICFLTISICLFSCTDSSSDDLPPEPADEILNMLNQHRQTLSLPPLVVNELAKKLAMEHANFMVSKRAVGAEGYEKRKEILRKDQNVSTVLEFNARFYDPPTLVRLWLDGDNKKFIEGTYTNIGVGVVKDDQGNNYYSTIIYRIIK